MTSTKLRLLTLRRSLLDLPVRLRARFGGGLTDRRNFDAEWYVSTNTGLPHRADYFRHFVTEGIHKGCRARFFDAGWYERTYPDMRHSRYDAWTHYSRFGKAEGRRARFFYINTLDEGRYDVRGFDEWINNYDTLNAAAVNDIQVAITRFQLTRPIDVLLRLSATDEPYAVLRAVTALRDQIYGRFRVFVGLPPEASVYFRQVVRDGIAGDDRFQVEDLPKDATAGAAFNRLAAHGASQFVCAVGARDILDPAALFRIAAALKADPSAQVLYGDEDRVDERDTRSRPLFKPQFNYELMLSYDLTGDVTVFSRDLVTRLNGFDPALGEDAVYDLCLRAAEVCGAGAVHHVPHILNHVYGTAPRPAPDADIVRRHLARTGRAGEVTRHPEVAGYNRVRFALPQPLPLVTLIIPTRDRVELLRMAVDSILAKTTYAAFEIIIVDNGSVEAETLTYFDGLTDSRVRVLRDPRPFNFSALNNGAVAVARGDYVCLVNNDIEILTPDWLEEMMSFATQPDVGCVGARLWYPDGTLQHGGVLVGFHGVAGHMHKFLPRGDSGYGDRAALHQSLSAVTAAVLLVKKSIYEAVGGFDESLAVAFNDVDFCLKVRDAGYRNIYTPFAEMNHHESASRGTEDSPEKKLRERREIDIIKTRYGESLMWDPAYNPNLTLYLEDLSLAFPPRARTVRQMLADGSLTVPTETVVTAD